MACIVRQICKKNPTFSNAFFAIYLLQSVADVVVVTMTIFTTRLPSVGYLPGFLCVFPVSNATFVVLIYCYNVQFIAHLATAIDRFRVIACVRIIKGDARVWPVVAAVLVVAVPPAIPGMMSVAAYAKVPGMNGYVLLFADAWVYLAGPILCSTYSGISTALSLALELKTLFAYRKMTIANRRRFRQDFLLFVYSLMQFALNLLLWIFFAIIAMASITKNPALAAVVQSTAPSYIVDAFCLSAPICLFSTSKALRKAYKGMYFVRVSVAITVKPATSTVSVTTSRQTV